MNEVIDRWLKAVPKKFRPYISFSVWGIALLIYGLSHLYAIKPTWFRSQDIKPSGINVNCNRQDRSCEIDIMVLNGGDASCIISGVVLTAMDMEFDPSATIQRPSLETSGWYYADISHIEKPGDKVSIFITEQVGADQPLRFSVFLRATELGVEARTWRFWMDLKINDDIILPVGEIKPIILQ